MVKTEWWWQTASLSVLILIGLVGVVVAITSAFLVVPWILAALTVLLQPRQQLQRLQQLHCICTGRVWHTRFLPTRHAFSYPIFFTLLRLDGSTEQQDCDRNKPRGASVLSDLFPLSLIVKFCYVDHLINGEGRVAKKDENGGSTDRADDTSADRVDSLQSRIFRLVAERTHHPFCPNGTSHAVYLLTHLRYYGYCFNPVSFYYIVRKDGSRQNAATDDDSTVLFPTERIDAVVGEVSNTPWNEMHCYVLHEASRDDRVQVVERPVASKDQADDATMLHYVFPKAFHVSPFMEMTYDYVWKFRNTPATSSIWITNSMRRTDNQQLQFHATLQLQAKPFTVWRMAYQLSFYPIFCAVVQIWIHYQALWLFVKGVPFQPHPDDAETAASRMIACIMAPFFALQDLLKGNQRETNGKTEKGD